MAQGSAQQGVNHDAQGREYPDECYDEEGNLKDAEEIAEIIANQQSGQDEREPTDVALFKSSETDDGKIRFPNLNIDYTDREDINRAFDFSPDGKFSTDDPREIELLRNNPNYGSRFMEVTGPEFEGTTAENELSSLKEEDIEDMDRRDLRSLASRHPSINGNKSTSYLENKLKESLANDFEGMDEAPSRN